MRVCVSLWISYWGCVMKNGLLIDLVICVLGVLLAYWFFSQIELPSETLRKVEQEQLKAVDNAKK